MVLFTGTGNGDNVTGNFDVLYGLGGNDTLDPSPSPNGSIYTEGGAGDDSIRGVGAFADSMLGGFGNDSILGGTPSDSSPDVLEGMTAVTRSTASAGTTRPMAAMATIRSSAPPATTSSTAASVWAASPAAQTTTR